MAKKQSGMELLTIETIAGIAKRVNTGQKFNPAFMELLRKAAECKKKGPRAFIDFADKYRVSSHPEAVSIKSMADKGEIEPEDIGAAAEVVEMHFCQALLAVMVGDE